MINIYEPYLNKENLKFAHDALDSTWISSTGKYLNLVKDELKNINGNEFVLLCNNGTTATHLLAIGLKYKYPRIKKLIVPNNVYVAAWNSFLVNPVYELIPIDSDLDTWNIDLNLLEKEMEKNSPKDTAVLIVHNIGNIINVPKLKEKYKDWIFLEDNCEGFLGEYSNFKTGSKSLLSSISFYGNKNITSGEGGAVFTDDEDLFEFLNSTRSQGNTNQKFIFDKLGYNYRMTNLQAAILYGQIKNLDEITDKKNFVFETYKANLSDFKLQKIEDDTKHSNWMLGIKLDNNADKLALDLYKQGVETRPMFPTMSMHHHLNSFSNIDNEINSEILYNNCIILPSHPNLQKNDINYICDLIKKNKSK
jgi:perosamine synthetase